MPLTKKGSPGKTTGKQTKNSKAMPQGADFTMPDLRDPSSLDLTPVKDIEAFLRMAQLDDKGSAPVKRKRLRDALEIPSEQMDRLQFKAKRLSRAQTVRALQLRGLSTEGTVTDRKNRLLAHVRDNPTIDGPAKRAR